MKIKIIGNLAEIFLDKFLGRRVHVNQMANVKIYGSKSNRFGITAKTTEFPNVWQRTWSLTVVLERLQRKKFPQFYPHENFLFR